MINDVEIMQSYSVMHQDVSRSCAMSSDIFPFSDLPGELRNEIYRHYLGRWDAVIEYDRKSARFKIHGQPEYSLMLASRAILCESSCLIPRAFSGKLILKDAKIRRENGFGYVSSFDAIAGVCPSWLLKRTTILSIAQGTTGMLMSLPWPILSAVQQIHLEGNSLPVGYYYSCGITATTREAQLKHILEGKYDTWCLNGHDMWSQTPEAIKEGRVRVLTIRRGSVKSATLNIWVEHKADCAEVIYRTVNSVVQLDVPQTDTLKMFQKIGLALVL